MNDTGNTLRNVKTIDWIGMKDASGTFLDWYMMHCQEIRDIAERLIESEDDVLTMILSNGPRRAHEMEEIAALAEEVCE